MSTWNSQLEELVAAFNAKLDQVDIAPLPPQVKVEYLKSAVIPGIDFYMFNIYIPIYTLDELDSSVRSHVRFWMNQATNSNRLYFFVPRAQDGLGIRCITTLYHARRISFGVGMLNSDDAQVRLIARNSWKLHMSRRKVELVGPSAVGAHSRRLDVRRSSDHCTFSDNKVVHCMQSWTLWLIWEMEYCQNGSFDRYASDDRRT